MLANRLLEAVQSRERRGMLRKLRYDDVDVDSASASSSLPVADFSSNDYLGLARSSELESQVAVRYDELKSAVTNFGGATGSRLLSGDSPYYQQVERNLARFFGTESALLFNSGYDANLSLLSSLPQPDTLVLYDELVHNSCREGLRLCRAKQQLAFKHNDVADVRRLLLKGDTFTSVIIVVESLYSMDGDLAPIAALCDLADELKQQRQLDVQIVVDEAHGTGVYGQGGRGYCHEAKVDARVFCRVHTFGKAVGCHGAVIVGSLVLRKYLLNYARPLIYSTSLPLHSLVYIECAFVFMERVAGERQSELFALVGSFAKQAKTAKLELAAADAGSPIQAVIVRGNERVASVARAVQQAGFDVYPIRAPTVPAGEERIRVVLHAFNTQSEVAGLVLALQQAVDKEK